MGAGPLAEGSDVQKERVGDLYPSVEVEPDVVDEDEEEDEMMEEIISAAASKADLENEDEDEEEELVEREASEVDQRSTVSDIEPELHQLMLSTEVATVADVDAARLQRAEAPTPSAQVRALDLVYV